MIPSCVDVGIPAGQFADASQTINVIIHIIYGGSWGVCANLNFVLFPHPSRSWNKHRILDMCDVTSSA
jgi:hypothetical protein